MKSLVKAFAILAVLGILCIGGCFAMIYFSMPELPSKTEVAAAYQLEIDAINAQLVAKKPLNYQEKDFNPSADLIAIYKEIESEKIPKENVDVYKRYSSLRRGDFFSVNGGGRATFETDGKRLNTVSYSLNKNGSEYVVYLLDSKLPEKPDE